MRGQLIARPLHSWELIHRNPLDRILNEPQSRSGHGQKKACPCWKSSPEPPVHSIEDVKQQRTSMEYSNL